MSRRPRALLAVLGLAALVAALHGGSVGGGLFMDDYAHRRQLRESGWSLAGLTDACRLELVGGVAEVWWLPETTLRFFRPVAFGLMRLEYVLTGWSPAALHVASLLWHGAACVLLMQLLARLGAGPFVAWGVAALFAIHPAHVGTVQWIACQSELMVTVFLLAATLCHARFRGWAAWGATWTGGSARWGAAAAGFFALALGCRENAIVLPVVLAAVDLLAGVRIARRTGWYYVALLGIAAGYVVLRGAALGGVQVPPRPYVIQPVEPDFARFVLDKALYYLLGEFLLIPCVPIAGLPYFQARPAVFYTLGAIVVGLLACVAYRYRRTAAGVLVPVWLAGFMAPTLPVFASPHHLYLPGVGWAIVTMLALRALAGDAAAWWRRTSVGVAVGGAGVLFALLTYYAALIFETGRQVEDCLVDELAAADLADGDVLYTANMPIIGHYARLALEERTGRRGLRLVPLTWAPRVLGVTTPTELRWLDERTIELHIRGDRYFADAFGLLVREALGREVPDEADHTAALGFRMRVLERDAQGITALRFEFVRPLTDPRIHLFWGSRARWGCEVRP